MWFAYCLGVVPTWGLVFFGYRDAGAGRLRAWTIASVAATVWPVFIAQFRVWLRRRRREHDSWVDEVERDLHSLVT
jgi:hypothetical protein